MTPIWDFTWYMLRLRRYKSRRLLLEIRTQPGWEGHVRGLLQSAMEEEGPGRASIAAIRHPGRVEVRRPRALAAVLAHFDPPQALMEAVGVYVRLCSEQGKGRRPDLEMVERQHRAVSRVLSLFPNPPRPAPSAGS